MILAAELSHSQGLKVCTFEKSNCLHRPDEFFKAVTISALVPLRAIGTRHESKGMETRTRTMNLKALVSLRAASRREHETRVVSRALRDHDRRESRRVSAPETRARGHHLYDAWSRKPCSEIAVFRADGFDVPLGKSLAIA